MTSAPLSHHRHLRRHLALGILLLASACAESDSSGSRPARPNVLLLTLDTTRADRLGCYGASATVTPRIDQLAREGLLVERALAPTPVTLPSHTSLLTGLEPIRHGVRDNGLFEAKAELETLAEVLRKAGWTTTAFVSAHVLSATYGLDQGFTDYDDRMHTVAGGGVSRVERRAGATVNAALEWMARDLPEPWFLWLHFYDPHHPYSPPEPFASRFPDPYDGELAYLDQQISRFLHRYDEGGRLDRTLLVITADHGEGLGEHHESSHGLFLYDTTLHVPLILRGPGVRPGSRLAGQVALVDVFPTLLDLLDLPLPGEVSGHSFHQALNRPGATVWHDVYLETLLPFYNHGLSPVDGVATKQHKWIQAPRPELFAWTTDPDELDNLVGSDDALEKRLQQQLERLRGGPSTKPPAPHRILDDEEAKALAALGYIHTEVPEEYQGADPKDFIKMQEARTEAMSRASNGDLVGARQVILEVIEKFPRDAGGHAILGKIYLQENSLTLAIEELLTALSLRADDTGAAADLGRARAQLGEPEAALQAFEQAIAHSPSFLNAYEEAAKVCLQLLEDHARARTYLKRGRAACRLGPKAAQELDARIEALGTERN